MIQYFKNIWSAATTIFEGLTITVSHFFRRPITIQYPDRTKIPVIDMLPERSHGFLKADMSICTGCLICMQACPIQCIEIKIEKRETSPSPLTLSPQGRGSNALPEGENPAEAPKPAPAQRLITKFDIDIGKCMFCGLCTEPCPTNAIHFTKEFERATENLDDLTFKFVDPAKPVVPYKRGA